MADVPQTLPVEFGQEYRVKLGKSFTFPKENAFHTIKYDFKPLSLDQGQPGRLRVSEGDEVAVSLPMVQAESSAEGAQVYFKGSRKACTKECILIINGKTGEATLEKISDTVQLKVVRDGTERARSTKLLRDHSVSPIPAQQQQKQAPPVKGQAAATTTNTTPSSTPQPSERQTPTLQSTPKAPKKGKSATKSPNQAPNKRKLDAAAAAPVPAAATSSTAAVLNVPQPMPSFTVQAPTPVTPSPTPIAPSPVPSFTAFGQGQGIPTKKMKQSSSSTSDSSSSSGSSSEDDSDSDMLMSNLQGEPAPSSMEVNQLLGHFAAGEQSGVVSGGLPVVNSTNVQAMGPTNIQAMGPTNVQAMGPTNVQAMGPTNVQAMGPTNVQAMGPTNVQAMGPTNGQAMGPTTASLPVASLQVPTNALAAGSQRVGQFAGKMPTPQDNAVIGIMSSESGNSSSGSSSSDSSDSSDENDNEVANAFGYPPAPPPQRTISQLRTDLELSESGSDSEP